MSVTKMPSRATLGRPMGKTPLGELWVMNDGGITFYAEDKRQVWIAAQFNDTEWEDFCRTVLRAKVRQREVKARLHGHDVVQVVRVDGSLVVAEYRRCEIALRRSGTIKPTFCIVCRTGIAKGEERYVEEPHRGSCRHFQRSSWCLACVPAIPRARGLREVSR